MTEKKEDQLLDHDYDGIREFDNPLPQWWLATFYGAIVFSVFYILYYHMGPGLSPRQALKREMEELQTRQKTVEEQGFSEDDLKTAFRDPRQLQAGGNLFKDRCAVCHGAGAEGQIGPNLTDKFWLHGDGSLPAILKVVSNGVPDKGMPPWKTMLKPEEILTVVAFVRSLRGTHPANAKAPQGTEVPEAP